MSDFIEIKGNIVQPEYNEGKGPKSIMMLTYYRNNLVHVFINEAEIATSLISLTNNQIRSTDFETLYQKSQFLKEILNEEFVLRDTFKTTDDFNKLVNIMSSRGFL